LISRASNSVLCRGSGGNTQVVDIYDGNYDVEETDVDDGGGTCELYLGLACAEFVRGRAVFVRSEVQQSDVETRLKGESIVLVVLRQVHRASRPVFTGVNISAGLNPVEAPRPGNRGAPREFSPNTTRCAGPSAKAYTCCIESSV